jgi:hypothetical protein
MSTAHPDRQPVPPYRRRLAEKLRAAADLLATNGWIQGAPSDEHDRYCMGGAVNVVTDDADVFVDALDAIVGHLDAIVDHLGTLSITWWNDQPGRTAEEVIAVLRETAAEQDARAAALEMEMGARS